MKNEKEKIMLCTKISLESHELLRKLCFETNSHKYQLLEEGIKLLEQKYKGEK